MNRRRFIGSLAGLAVASVLPALPLPPVVAAVGNPLFRGELGRWEGVRFIDTRAARVYSAALAAQLGRVSYFEHFRASRAERT